MKNYTHIFFDLDHTLWDYDTNASLTLAQLFHAFDLSRYYTGVEAFLKSFHYHNDLLWYRYNQGEINRNDIREERFRKILGDRGVDIGQEALRMADFYTMEGPKKTGLIPNAMEILEYLSGQYQLAILSNGFDDIQEVKMKDSGLTPYFKWIITSESSGHRKPSKEIFQHALDLVCVDKNNVLMVGDNYKVDILGAKNAGWKAVWFNPLGNQDYHHDLQIKNLLELKELL